MTRPDASIVRSRTSRTSRTAAVTAAVAALVTSIAVAAPAHAATPEYPPGTVEIATVVDSVFEGYSSRITTTTVLDGHGVELSAEVSVDDGIDGTVEERVVYEYEYDDRGAMILVRELRYDGATAMPTTITTRQFVYDKKGVLLSRVEAVDNGGDGTVDDTTSITVTRESDPLTITSVTTRGSGSTSTVVEVLDKKGRSISHTATDENAQGEVTAITDVRHVYDGKGALLSEVVTVTQGTVVDVTTTTLTYTDKGLLAGYTTTGSSRGTAVGELTYDDKGRQTLYEVTTTPPVGPVEYTVDQTTYDDKGVFAAQRFEAYVDGRLVYSLQSEAVYDDRGNIAVYTTSTADEVSVTELTHDKKGNVLTTTATHSDAEGRTLQVVDEQRTYDKRGHLVSSSSTYDLDGDGDIDGTYTFTSTIS